MTRTAAVVVLALVAAAAAGATSPAPAQLEPFLDGLVPGLLSAHHVPGAVVVIVDRDGVLAARGYGYANLETRQPVAPAQTRFRVASLSKLVTATAAMQQVERGNLTLEGDVNRWLGAGFVPDAFDAPVTLAHLLTHTPGFDDRFLGSTLPVDAPRPVLGAFLRGDLPRRIAPPGRRIRYSNHGLATVGLLVERAAGRPFGDVVREDVLEPLGMSHSRFGLEVPVGDDVAIPYDWRGGRFEPMAYDYTLLGPAAELNTTGLDMARFMRAHLNEGALDGRRILAADTARTMHATQFRNHPDAAGWCYGFQERFVRGERALVHLGEWHGFRSSLLLLPATGLGIFISLNVNLGPRAFLEDFERAFADRWLGPAPGPLEPPADFAARAGRYTGTYLPERRIRDSVLRVGDLLQFVRVTATDDGALVLTPPGAPPIHFVETGPDAFRERDGERTLHFLDGDADHAPGGLTVGAIALERRRGLRDPALHAAFAAGAVGLCLATLIGWALGAVGRLLGGAASPLVPSARFAAATASALLTAAFVGLGLALVRFDIYALFQAIPASMRVQMWLPLLALPFALAMPWFALRGFRTGAPAPLARAHYALLTVAAFGLLALAFHWNLIPPRT